MSLRDLVAYLGNRKATGTLLVERPDERHQVVISEGAVIQAGSNAPREYLAQFLMNMGMITEDEYTEAFQEQLATKVALGKILVDSGKVPEDAIRNALSLKFREALLGCFDWTEGRFTFTPGDTPTAVQGLDVSVSLLDVHREADLRQTAWRAIREVFPTGRVRLRLDREQLVAPPESGSLDDRLYTLIDDGATIDDLVLGLHSTDFFLYQRLFALHRLGAVSVVPTESPTVPTEVPEVLGSEQGPDGDPPRRRGLLRLGERVRRCRSRPPRLRGLAHRPDRELPAPGRGRARRPAQGRAGAWREGAPPPGFHRIGAGDAAQRPGAISLVAHRRAADGGGDRQVRPSTSWTRSAASRASSSRG